MDILLSILNIADLVILIILLILVVILYPVMGVVFLFKYFKTKRKDRGNSFWSLFRKVALSSPFILLFFFTMVSLTALSISELTSFNLDMVVFFIVFFGCFYILPITLGVIFIKKYSKTKIKKYRLLGLGYFLIPVTVLLWGLVSFLVAQLSKPDELLCYAPPPPDHLFFNNTLSPELISYKESLADKFAGSLPENVVNKISDS